MNDQQDKSQEVNEGVPVITPSSSPHSPLPWCQWRTNLITTHGSIEIAQTDINSYMAGSECSANAEFIVRACNSHYDLLAALKELLPVIAGQARGQSWAEWMTELGIAELKARAAIAKAEGK